MSVGMDELERLADEIAGELAKKQLNTASFDLNLAREKATRELRDEIDKILKRKAKQVYGDSEYAVFAAKMSYYYQPSAAARKYYNAKAEQREYQAVWVLGVDTSQAAGFWIHRLVWRPEFETYAEKGWQGLTNAKIKEWMGFAKEEGEAWAAQPGEWVRLVGDLRMRLVATKKQEIEREVERAKEDAPLEYADEHEDEQDVSEDEIRKYKEEQGWKVLSAKRRQEAVKALKWRKAREAFERNKEQILAQVARQAENTIEKKYAELKDLDVRIGNHVIKFAAAREIGGWETYVVLARGLMVTVHEEHGQRKYVLPEGRYELSLLPRHITQQRR
jgi:hypothetical protein